MIGSRIVREFIDDDGVLCKAVSLNNATGLEAITDEETFRFLFDLGLSLAWRLRSGYVVSPSMQAPGGYVSVARVATGAGPNQIVRYRNSDALDLRRGNLTLEEGHGLRTDRYLVKPKPERVYRSGPPMTATVMT